MIGTYTIESPVFFSGITTGAIFIRDTEAEPRHETFLRHVRTGDYFAVLATVLGFIEEALTACAAGGVTPSPRLVDEVRDIRRDLRYLDRRYTIVPKPDTRPRPPLS